MDKEHVKKKLVLILPVHDKTKRGKGKSYLPPTTLSVLSSLTPLTWDVFIIDENIGEYNKRKNMEKIKEADLVGISVMTSESIRAYNIADDIRKLGKRVVLGGYHITACSKESEKYADALVIGRAEGIWEKLIADTERDELEKEYKNETEQKFINPNKRIQPWLKRKQILPTWFRGYGIKHMTYTSVGCTQGCPFCYNSKRKILFTPRDVKEVKKELSQFYGERIAFCDDDIVSDNKHAENLFNAIKVLNLRWLGLASIKIGLPEQKKLLELAADSGCEWLFIGFETFCENEFGKLRRLSNDPNKYLDVIKQVHNAGIKVNASFMIGLENETMSDIHKIIDFIDRGSPERVDIYFLTPFPGTVLYDRLKDNTKILKDWSLFDAQHIVWRLSEHNRNELINRFNSLRKSIYSWKSIFKRSIPQKYWNISERCKLLIINLHKRRKFERIAKDL